MRLTPRLTIAMGMVAVAPLGLAGWSAIVLSESALRARTAELHQQVARSLAERLDTEIQHRLASVQQLVGSIEFSALGPEARVGVERLLFRQVDDASLVALFDADDGQAAAPVYLQHPSKDDALARRPVVTEQDVERFADYIPINSAREVASGVISAPYTSAGGAPRLTLAVTTPGDFVVGVELALDELNRQVAEYRVGPRGVAYVVDAAGLVVLSGSAEAVASRADRSQWSAVKGVLATGAPPDRFDDPRLGPSLGAAHPIAALDWWVIVSEPEADALAASRALSARTLLWLGIAVLTAGLLGWFTARAIARPVIALHEGAKAIEGGDLTHRIEGEDRKDEFGTLARAFNAMAGEVLRWRTELEDRVAERTRQLEETQELLVRSQKLAATGQLGAGVAHEINNPLTGVLGLVQIVLAKLDPDSKEHRLLGEVKNEAERIREIVERLRELTVDNRAALEPMDLRTAMQEALSASEPKLEELGIEIRKEFTDDLPQVMGNLIDLTEVFHQLLANATTAMREGGVLTVVVAAEAEGRLVVGQVRDTGPGIDKADQSRVFDPFYTGKEDWNAKGLGLSLVSRIVEEHGGTITIESKLGEGATFSVRVPARAKKVLV